MILANKKKRQKSYIRNDDDPERPPVFTTFFVGKGSVKSVGVDALYNIPLFIPSVLVDFWLLLLGDKWEGQRNLL